jgi:6-phospho-3-hexuloisomerase
MRLPRANREVFLSENPETVKFPQALDKMLGELGGVFARLAPETSSILIRELEAAPRIFGCAAGRSGFILRGFLMRLMHLGLTVYVVGETITPRLQAGDLLIVMSGSGETAQPREIQRHAKALGARTLALTACPDSTIGREAHVTIHIPGTTKLTLAQEPDSAQCPGSLFEQATFLLLEAVVLFLYEKHLGGDQDEMLARHANLE